jgi:hypothetical protein
MHSSETVGLMPLRVTAPPHQNWKYRNTGRLNELSHFSFLTPRKHEPGKVTVLGCIAMAWRLVLTFSLTGCNGRCLTTPKLRLWDAPASSEFSRVLPGFLFKGYLRCFLQVGITAKVKRIKAMGEVPV